MKRSPTTFSLLLGLLALRLLLLALLTLLLLLLALLRLLLLLLLALLLGLLLLSLGGLALLARLASGVAVGVLGVGALGCNQRQGQAGDDLLHVRFLLGAAVSFSIAFAQILLAPRMNAT